MNRPRLFIAAFIFGAACLLPRPGLALTLSPPTFDFSANPGDTLNEAVRLQNETTGAVVVKADVVNFTHQTNDSGDGVPEFYPKNETRDGRGLAPWISLVNPSVPLGGGERGAVFFDIKVPSDAEPGSYFGAVLISTESPKGADEGVGVIGNTAVLVFLKVNGATVEDLQLTSFDSGERFYASLPAEFDLRVENKGTVHLRPVGTVTITNALGKAVGVVDVNRLEYKSVLPDSTRRYAARWSRANLAEGVSELEKQWRNFAFGPYTADLALEYGSGPKHLVASTRFWVVPWMALGSAAAAILLTWLIVRSLLASYRRRIIRQVEAAHKNE